MELVRLIRVPCGEDWPMAKRQTGHWWSAKIRRVRVAKLRPHRAIRDGILAGQTLNFRLNSQQVRVSKESCLGWCLTQVWNLMPTQLEPGTFTWTRQQNLTVILSQGLQYVLFNSVTSRKECDEVLLNSICNIKLKPKPESFNKKFSPTWPKHTRSGQLLLHVSSVSHSHVEQCKRIKR